ncbi:unnamed protein product [Cylicostephanus goldi]|uniref:Uncharacterized protein n=1 Tax=Cylicostephanus goldi TaxID=71465 RepID=A0A3P7MWG3_CYLGO|nr:unnamed protein product [Cylicostephanus goldi]
MEATRSETKPVWVYVIFRKNHCSGHEKMTVNISFDGPIFWNRQVAYIYCCSCHFDEHEVRFRTFLSNPQCIQDDSYSPQSFFFSPNIHVLAFTFGPLMAILSKFEQRVERMCLVDRPVDYPFLPDSIFSYMAKCMPKLQVSQSSIWKIFRVI